MGKLYSHSRLSAFEQCKLRYKYSYIDRIKREEDSIETFLGSRFHETMERAYAERAFWKPSDVDLTKYFDELWDKNFGEHVFVSRKDRTAEDYRKIGHKAIADYHRRYSPYDSGRVLGLEKRILADLDGTGAYQVQGYIDRVMETDDGHFEIHDYKTSGNLPDQTKLDSDRQLALYEIAVRQLWPKDVKQIDLVWHYVVFDKELRSSRTPEQLEELKSNTIALIDEIERTDEYPPSESNLCRWCDYQDICPLFAHQAKTDELPLEKYLNDDGVAIVNRLSELDARKRELKAEITTVEDEEATAKEAAIALAAKDGVSRFFGKDHVLTIKDDIDVDYPKSNDERREGFENVLSDMNLLGEVSSINGLSIKSLAKKSHWSESMPEELGLFIKTTRIMTARLGKKKQGEE